MPGISFDRAAGYYDATRGYGEGVDNEIRDAIIRVVSATAATRFLELGVGTGRIALPFIRGGYDYTGVDISQAMMDRLEQKLAEDQDKAKYCYRLVQGDITDALPFENGYFDVIITVHVLHLMADWQGAINEAKRLLNKEGRLVIAYDFNEDNSAPEPLARRKWDEILKKYGRERQGPGVWADDPRLKDYLQAQGATIEVVTLIRHNWPPLSIREVADRLVNRFYSSDWETPAEIHVAASEELLKWVNEEAPEPDRKASARGEMRALIQHW